MQSDRYPASVTRIWSCHYPPVVLAFCLALAAPAVFSNPDFHAPFTGERVEKYDVTLPVSPNEKQTFSIPADCPAAHYASSHGAQQWSNRVDRRVWDKVMQDCYYVAFLQQARKQPVHDYVSGYDFMNADLHDLVVDSNCGRQIGVPCEPLPPGVIDLRQVLAHVSIGGPNDQPAKPEECRVENGLFRGWVEFRKDGLACRSDKKANGFRMIAVDFADVNADGFVDAVIRVIPMGRGQRHIPLILPLTRMQPDGPFMIPPHLPRF